MLQSASHWCRSYLLCPGHSWNRTRLLRKGRTTVDRTGPPRRLFRQTTSLTLMKSPRSPSIRAASARRQVSPKRSAEAGCRPLPITVSGRHRAHKHRPKAAAESVALRRSSRFVTPPGQSPRIPGLVTPEMAAPPTGNRSIPLKLPLVYKSRRRLRERLAFGGSTARTSRCHDSHL